MVPAQQKMRMTMTQIMDLMGLEPSMKFYQEISALTFVLIYAIELFQQALHIIIQQ